MVSNFQAPVPPLSVLALLGSVVLTVLSIATAGVLALRRRKRWALAAATVAAAVPAIYAVALFGLAFLSRDITVPPGEEKVFCDVDCHIANSVVGSESPATLGTTQPVGRFVVVALRTHFDEKSIGPHRGDSPLEPNPKDLALVDSAGRSYPLDPRLQEALQAARGDQTPLTKPLRPGEAYITALAFDVPRDASGLRLLITESDWPARLLLAHETGPLHGKAYLALP